MPDVEPLEVSPETAARRLRQEPDAIYLDVRTVGEFTAGHPPGALNVPFVTADPRTGAPVLNPHFLRVVRAHVDDDQPILCGCATGIRSLHAVHTLRAAGYAAAVNVDAGFDGKSDPFGRLVAPGWKALGYEVEIGDGGERGYVALSAAAGGGEG